jgi:hypothetical protein
VIIDETYFTGNLTIAQLSQMEVRDDLDLLIEREEPKYLKLLLGLRFYNAFIAGISPISGAEQRWLNLLNGIEYEYNNREYQWIGFENDLKQSPIANYVYTQYLKNLVETMTGVGTVKPATENGSLAFASPKIVRAWNEMVEWQTGLIRYLRENRSIYPEWRPYSSNYWFLASNGTLYTNYYNECNHWPDIFHKQNTLGI